MVPVFTLERQNKILDKELQKTIKEVIDGGVYILGPKVDEFEKAFADYLGVKYAVGVASGTDALSLGLLSVGVEAGDEVILPANCYPTVFAITTIGATPKLVDIDPLTFNIDPAKIPPAVTQKTKAIIAVHLYGQPADMEAIMKIGREYHLPVIEDCAQAHGAEIRIQKSLKLPKSLRSLKERTEWRKVGTIGDVGCFSFYPTKNLGCLGDGGMVVTNNGKIARQIKLLRMYGEEGRYKSIVLGRNSRLDELQAAILLLKLKYLDRWNKRRREIAQLYFSHFFGRPKKWEKERPPQWEFASFSNLGQSGGDLGYSSRFLTFATRQEKHANIPMGNKHVFHLFVIRSKERDKLKAYLEERGIQTAIHYPSPIHLQPSFKYLGYKLGDFPESEKACREILSLPMFPELKDEEVEKVCSEVKRFYKES